MSLTDLLLADTPEEKEQKTGPQDHCKQVKDGENHACYQF